MIIKEIAECEAGTPIVQALPKPIAFARLLSKTRKEKARAPVLALALAAPRAVAGNGKLPTAATRREVRSSQRSRRRPRLPPNRQPTVTVSGGGVTNVGGAAGVQVIRQANGDFAAAASAPAAAPPKSAPTTKPGTVTGGPKGGFLGALGNGIVDGVKGAGKAVANGAESVITAGSPRPGSPAAGAPKASTTTQQ